MIVAVIVAVLAIAVALYCWQLASRRGQALAALRIAAEIEANRNVAGAELSDQLTLSIHALDDGVVVYSTRGEVLRNPAAQRFVGARHADAIVEAGIVRLAELGLRGSPGAEELALVGPPRMVFSLRCEPLLDHDLVLGAVVWIRDVSDARRVDEMRRDFVANVSHELRTPVGALALLAETIADEPDAQVIRQFSERMVREADRLGRTIDDLLDLSVIESHEQFAVAPVSVREAIDHAVSQVANAATLKQITICCDCDPDLQVSADRRQLISAIFNLLDNAVKYSEPVSTVHVTAVADDSLVSIAVSDQGIGIPTRDLERVFERFYRVDRARSRESGGTGLGLSIVRHVAATHGGSVRVTSHEGEGSTFVLELPLIATSSEVNHG